MANILMRKCRLHGRSISWSQKYFSFLQTTNVLSENVNGKKVLTLNRPEKLNTLNMSMVTKLYENLKVFI